MTKDAHDPVTKDRQDPVTKDRHDPVTKDPHDPVTKDRQDPVTKDPEEPPTQPEEPPTETPCPDLPRCADLPAETPAAGGDGGGGVGAVLPPRGRLLLPPEMRLPPPREVGPAGSAQPAVVAAVPVGVGAAAVPLALVVLPVVVLPTVGLSGGRAPPAAPAGVAPLPLAPGAVTAEPPAVREPLPANVGDNNAVLASSYRVGYAEYLRTAGMSQIAALAFPGVAGMLVITGAGGFIGYRQAKAGHVVRTGRAARFVN